MLRQFICIELNICNCPGGYYRPFSTTRISQCHISGLFMMSHKIPAWSTKYRHNTKYFRNEFKMASWWLFVYSFWQDSFVSNCQKHSDTLSDKTLTDKIFVGQNFSFDKTEEVLYYRNRGKGSFIESLTCQFCIKSDDKQ